MYAVPKDMSGGRVKWYLRYWDKGVLKNVPKKIYPDFWTQKDAEKWIKSKKGEKELDFIKKHVDGLKWLKWKNEFTHINSLLKEFTNYYKHRDRAPNSYKSVVCYLEHFVINFFIEVQKDSNLKNWCRYHEEFQEYLEFSAFKKGTKTTIAYSTKNHCIRAYNIFMKFLVKKKYIEPRDRIPCECFSQHLVEQTARGYKDMINPGEYKQLIKRLDVSKDFFITLYNTGCRFTELLSLPLSAVHVDNENFPSFMREKFESLGREIFGYLVLENQMKHKNIKRHKKTGWIDRKPLKGRKGLSFKDARIIPITDVDTWNIIVTNYNRALKEFKNRENISSREEDYLLFNESMNRIRRDFYKHCKKGFHACRHSYITNLVGDTRDMIITQTIVGHRSDSFLRYLHIYEEMSLKAKKGKGPGKRTELSLVEGHKKAG